MVDSLTLSIPEAAKILGISRGLAYALAKEGKLPVLQLGHRLLIPRVALDRMLAGAAVQGKGKEVSGPEEL